MKAPIFEIRATGLVSPWLEFLGTSRVYSARIQEPVRSAPEGRLPTIKPPAETAQLARPAEADSGPWTTQHADWPTAQRGAPPGPGARRAFGESSQNTEARRAPGPCPRGPEVYGFQRSRGGPNRFDPVELGTVWYAQKPRPALSGIIIIPAMSAAASVASAGLRAAAPAPAPPRSS